jgi:hypothetical protein
LPADKLRLKKRTDAAGAAFPPQKAGDLDIAFARGGGQANDRLAGMPVEFTAQSTQALMLLVPTT